MPDLRELVALMPFAEQLGVELDAASGDEVRGRLVHRPELCTAGGILHGGALMAFADSLGAVCAYLRLGADESTATTSSTTHFVRAAAEGAVTGVARPLHAGRTQIVLQTDVRDARDRLVTQTTQTQVVIAAA